MKICFNKTMSLEHMSYLPERQQDDYFCTTKSQFVIGSKSVHLFCRHPNKLSLPRCFTVLFETAGEISSMLEFIHIPNGISIVLIA